MRFQMQKWDFQKQKWVFRSTSLTAGLFWGFNTKWSFSKENSRAFLNGIWAPHLARHRGLCQETHTRPGGRNRIYNAHRPCETNLYEKPGGAQHTLPLEPCATALSFQVQLKSPQTWFLFSHFYYQKTGSGANFSLNQNCTNSTKLVFL